MSAPLALRLVGLKRVDTGLAALRKLLIRLAKSRPEVLDRSLDLVDEGTAFDLDCLPARRAGQLRIVLKPTDRLLNLMAACGAGDRDLGAIKKAFRHDSSPVVGSTPTVDRVGEGE